MFNGPNTFKGDLHPNNINPFDVMLETFTQDGLVHWLENCPDLRELRLELPSAPLSEWRVELRHVMGNLHLGHLTVLNLSNFQTTVEDIERCLLRHKSHLKELALGNVHLSTGAWPMCLSTFAGKLSHLSNVKITEMLTSVDEEMNEDVITYLAHSATIRHQKIRQREGEVAQYILEGKGEPPTWTVEAYEDGDSAAGEDTCD